MDNGLSFVGTAPSLLRITAEQLETMAIKGAFTGLPRVELRDGLLCQMSPQHFPHAAVKGALFRCLDAALNRLNLPLAVLTEVSVRVSDADVPIPDIVIMQQGWFPGAVPADRVCLVAEVSDNTLADDLGRKRMLYAAGGIPEYWVVDLGARAIFQHWQISDGTYAKSAVLPFGTPVTSVAVAGLIVPTDTLDLQRSAAPR